MDAQREDSDNSSDARELSEQPVVYGVVNDVLLRKHSFTINTYPGLFEFLIRIVGILEATYELVIRHGQLLQVDGVGVIATPPGDIPMPDSTGTP